MAWTSSPFVVARLWSVLLLLVLSRPLGTVADKCAADYFVRDLPGVPKDSPPIKMHAGHIEVTPEHHGNMFFWHFQNKHIANRQRTVIWVNGGPGCSSEDGALMEVGPYRVKDEQNLVLNNGSWNEFANLLFVDNPVGTGFSFVDTDSFVHELDTMAEQFVQFLDKFFALFPEYDRDHIYIAGESFAGQYIPYIAKSIVDRNKKNPGNEWNLKGLLIGNGWVSPKAQYQAYLKFALQKGLVDKDSEIANQLLAKQRICDKMLSTNPGHVNYNECEDVLSTLLRIASTGSGDNACYNMYDGLTPYLRRPAVIRALHVSDQRNTGWQECSGAVGSAFRSKNSKPADQLLPDLIKQVPVLFFSGAEDLICNHMGTELMIDNLEWSGGKGFEVTPGNWAPRRTWTFEGEVAGFWQEARNLTYVLYHNASHMVPFDFPRRSRDMLDRFMGVDISSIGGEPTDSRIDGEKGPETTVGGVSNHTQSVEETRKKVEEAKWAAYRKSGETVLVIVAMAAAAWGYFIWRQRRKGAIYRALRGEDHAGQGNPRTAAFRGGQSSDDLEATAFDETSLDDLGVESSAVPGESRYSIGDDSDGEEMENLKPRNGVTKGDAGDNTS
ncbi:serine carboxypeptidase [Hirsutella rhossiliensis]|uniref:Pheromone-processing carboxypeptidase KEX1 n=1 Tax=Hirsutella rhossiliensis TaxID=111463 RepID=A0A9P8SES3_9HYPO|nr:serine carboxypeptidase domain-containing protein [Hirsutella rhossiliensis]KAH0958326.1 serine carboxypeptidase domain-containing protein [Hirsutella rhossiliensis]